MTLLEILENIKELNNILNQSTDEELDLLLNELKENLQIKVNNYYQYIKHLEYLIAQDKLVIDKYKKNLERKEKTIEFLRNNLLFLVKQEGNITFTDEDGVVLAKTSIGKSSSVKVVDENKIPMEYFKIEKKPILTEIKNAIKNGISIEGVEIVENEYIKII